MTLISFLRFWLPRFWRKIEDSLLYVMIFLLIVAIWAAIFANIARADDGSLATCETKNMKLMEINGQLGDIAESFRSQLEAEKLRKVQVVRITPVAGKPVQRKAGPCGSQRQVWRTLANGHRKYKCR